MSDNIKKGLTEKQHTALEWIKDYIQTKGWSPSNDEIAQAMEVSSASAGEMVNRIVERGHLRKDGPRTLTIID